MISINILLDKKKKIYLTRDQYQYIVRKDTGKIDEKTEKQIYNNLSYHKSLDQVAHALYTLKINDSIATTIAEFQDEHDKIIEEIREIFNLKGLVE